jgi:hypothetical protein
MSVINNSLSVQFGSIERVVSVVSQITKVEVSVLVRDWKFLAMAGSLDTGLLTLVEYVKSKH